MANHQCEADFIDLSAGTCRVSVSGQTIAESDVGSFAVSPSGSAEFEVELKRANNGPRKKDASGSGCMVASDLQIPWRAKKAFDQAGELKEKRDFNRSMEKLNQAIRIYPAYAAACDNLGVIYARLGDHGREEQVLRKAS